MMNRTIAKGEPELHSTMRGVETLKGMGRGALAGGALGVAGKATGVTKLSPAIVAALGSAAGGLAGYGKGRERALQDIVRERRATIRREESKMKKSYDEVVMAAFADEIEKTALGGIVSAAKGLLPRLGGLAQGVGSKIMGTGASLLSKVSPNAAGRVMQLGQKVGVPRLNTIVGGAALGAGALGAAGLGSRLIGGGQQR